MLGNVTKIKWLEQEWNLDILEQHGLGVLCQV